MINFVKKKKKEIDLIPMINIIFLLLIFFMLTGTVQKKQVGEIDRINSEFSVSANISDKIIAIQINNGNKIFFENKQINLEKVTEIFLNVNKNSKILLDLDKNSEVRILNKILKVLRNSNFKKVFIKTTKRDDSVK